MSRFSDIGYLKDFQGGQGYPKIHDDIFQLIQENTDDTENILDLGCCYGLLAHRLLTGGRSVLGLDSSETFVTEGLKAFGNTPDLELETFKVTKFTANELLHLIREKNITVVVARRIFPEIVDNDAHMMDTVRIMLKEAGVKKIFIEGRVDSKRSTNLLHNLDAEIAMLSEDYRVTKRYKNCALLEK